MSRWENKWHCMRVLNDFFFQISPWKVVSYAVVTPFFFMALIVYYYAIWDYYYVDYPQYSNVGSREEEENVSGGYGSRSTHLRKRYGGRTLMY